MSQENRQAEQQPVIQQPDQHPEQQPLPIEEPRAQEEEREEREEGGENEGEQNDPSSNSPSYSSQSKSNQHQNQELKHQQVEGEEDGVPKTKQQASNPNEVQKTRYKYCCKVCKHTGQGKKACVCVVPLTERRTIIGEEGCQTCKCKGCSIEDFISRGQDPIYRVVKVNKQDIFDPKRMCCKKCMKAFYNNGKPCFCQYPPKQRKGKLKANGCSLCGCSGCNTDDYKEKPKQKRRTSKSRSREKDRKRKTRRSRSKSQDSRSSRKSSTDEVVDVKGMNLNNFDRSFLGNMIINEFRVFPALMGFGVPQRTQSYIMNQSKR